MKNKIKIIAVAICVALASLLFAPVASALYEPAASFATEVLLNKPGVSYDLSGIAGADNVIVRTREVPIYEPGPEEEEIAVKGGGSQVDETETKTVLDAIIYRSHYNPDVAVILSEDGLYGSEAKYLSVKLQIPTKEVSIPKIRIMAIGDMDIATLEFDKAKKLGWDAWVSGHGEWRTDEGEYVSMDCYSLEKGDISINMINYPKDRFPPEQTEMMATKYNATSLTEQEKEEMTSALVAIGFAADGESFWETATESVVDVPDLAPAIDIDADEFNWKEAMKTELTWLSDAGVIKGLTESDIDKASSACERGTAYYNGRIVFEDGEWLPYYETDNPLIRELIGADEESEGFSVDALPQGALEDVPLAQGDTSSSFNYIWVIVGIIVVAGAGIFIWRRRTA